MKNPSPLFFMIILFVVALGHYRLSTQDVVFLAKYEKENVRPGTRAHFLESLAWVFLFERMRY